MNNLTKAKIKERKFIIECIQLYKSLPALWNAKSKKYTDRDEKNLAYTILLAKYNEMFPNATKEDLKKKFNALRTNYRKELRKYKASENSGYEPTLWYFTEMNFLQDQENLIYTETSIDDTVKNIYIDPLQKNESPASFVDVNEDISDDDMNDSVSDDDLNDRLTFDEIPQKQEVKRKNNETRRLLNLSYAQLNENKDDFRHWAFACASDLRKMEGDQQIFAKKAIAEILMEGQLGLLHRHSVKINELHYASSYDSSVQFIQSTSRTSPSPKYGAIPMPSSTPTSKPMPATSNIACNVPTLYSLQNPNSIPSRLSEELCTTSKKALSQSYKQISSKSIRHFSNIFEEQSPSVKKVKILGLSPQED